MVLLKSRPDRYGTFAVESCQSNGKFHPERKLKLTVHTL